jgi:hypothetical protein
MAPSSRRTRTVEDRLPALAQREPAKELVVQGEDADKSLANVPYEKTCFSINDPHIDPTAMEIFFGTLTSKRVYDQRYHTRVQLKSTSLTISGLSTTGVEITLPWTIQAQKRTSNNSLKHLSRRLPDTIPTNLIHPAYLQVHHYHYLRHITASVLPSFQNGPLRSFYSNFGILLRQWQVKNDKVQLAKIIQM